MSMKGMVPLCSPPMNRGMDERPVDYLDAPGRLIRECPFDYDKL